MFDVGKPRENRKCNTILAKIGRNKRIIIDFKRNIVAMQKSTRKRFKNRKYEELETKEQLDVTWERSIQRNISGKLLKLFYLLFDDNYWDR